MKTSFYWHLQHNRTKVKLWQKTGAAKSLQLNLKINFQPTVTFWRQQDIFHTPDFEIFIYFWNISALLLSESSTINFLPNRVWVICSSHWFLNSSYWFPVSVSPLPATRGRCWSWFSGSGPLWTARERPLPQHSDAGGCQRPWWGTPSPRSQSSWHWSPGRRSPGMRPSPWRVHQVYEKMVSIH